MVLLSNVTVLAELCPGRQALTQTVLSHILHALDDQARKLDPGCADLLSFWMDSGGERGRGE